MAMYLLAYHLAAKVHTCTLVLSALSLSLWCQSCLFIIPMLLGNSGYIISTGFSFINQFVLFHYTVTSFLQITWFLAGSIFLQVIQLIHGPISCFSDQFRPFGIDIWPCWVLGVGCRLSLMPNYVVAFLDHVFSDPPYWDISPSQLPLFP